MIKDNNKEEKSFVMFDELREKIRAFDEKQKGYKVEVLDFDDIFPNK